MVEGKRQVGKNELSEHKQRLLTTQRSLHADIAYAGPNTENQVLGKKVLGKKQVRGKNETLRGSQVELACADPWMMEQRPTNT